MKSILLYVVLSMIYLISLTPFAISHAAEHKSPFPNGGLLWMSARERFTGTVYVSSNNCNTSETGAYAKVQGSTIHTSEMGKWYTYGIRMSQYRCDGQFTVLSDVRINYNSTYPSDAWGINNDTVADRNFCAFWGVAYPCGVRPTVSINVGTWNRVGDANRQRLIMHETGHSLGLSHHCSSASIMNDGTSGCNGGAWLNTMGYVATDRIGIDQMYPYESVLVQSHSNSPLL